jgi:hypothetical protein
MELEQEKTKEEIEEDKFIEDLARAFVFIAKSIVEGG